MTKRYIFSILFLFLTTVFYGQKLGEYYVSISIDSSKSCRLKFLSDTTVELSSVPLHMSPSFKSVFNYTKTDTTIQILPENVISKDTQASGLYVRHFDLKTQIILTKIDGGFIDYGKSIIYVRQKDFGDNPDIAYIIDGKTFIQDVGVTDGYGLLRKSPKTNKALQKKLKRLDKIVAQLKLLEVLTLIKGLE